MKLIPVLDLKSGQVVHAHRGDRDAYRPVETPLYRGSNPVDACRGLLGLHPFTTIYVADLDSIEGTGSNEAALAKLCAAFSDIEFWVDAGLPATGAAEWLQNHEGALVLGSESQASVEEVMALLADNGNRVILSLDSKGDVFLGPQELLSQTQLWPRRVILMTLARVGAGDGPDYDRLSEIMSRADDRQIIAAGGVRGIEDLIRLADMGVAGVLLASTLLDGRMGEAEIIDFYERQK